MASLREKDIFPYGPDLNIHLRETTTERLCKAHYFTRDILSRYGAVEVDLMHVNCEGCEWEMLENMVETEGLMAQVRVVVVVVVVEVVVVVTVRGVSGKCWRTWWILRDS